VAADAVPAGRVLVVTAHPDDSDFAAGGTLAGWAAEGAEIALCVCTSGESGDGPVAGEQLGALRRDEQRAAAAVLGIGAVSFLGYPDGRVEADLALRRDITRVIRQERPQRVLTHCPDPNWSRIQTAHPDHLAVGRATAAAVYPDARNPGAHPELHAEGLAPWTVPELWLMTPPPAAENRAVDVTDEVEAKFRALAEHRSQIADIAALRTAARFQMRQAAVRHGMPGRVAEVFQVVRSS
jgi:LmbE family N-acetylglucosaminyl deacetylase